ncbi:MAG: hypothetical protein IT538_12020 [Variibacter sp.]|nr:hypothetical protein [Variibacter sp.]
MARSAVSDPALGPRASGVGWLAGAQALPAWLPLVAIFVLGAALRPFIGTNTDVSWDITIVEKMLAGGRLYVDILEVNPPATAYLYYLPVVLARVLGVTPEFMVDALVLLAVAIALWLAGRPLRASGLVRPADAWLLAAAAAATLTVLPAYTFAEREHIALIALLPFLAALALRARGLRPDAVTLLAAGLGAGVTMVIKPHFALPVGMGIVAAAWSAGSWRVLFAAENWLAGAVAAAYGVFVVVAFPEFIQDVMPLVQTVYVPARLSLVVLLARAPVILWLAALRVLSLRRPDGMLRAPYLLLLAPSVGFFCAYLIQGKAWPYHSYPMLALAFLALAVAWVERRAEAREQAPASGRGERLKRWALAAAAPGLFLVSFFWFDLASPTGALAAKVRALQAHPTMLIISSDLSLGHPLVRQVEGTWVGRPGHLWITGAAYQQLVENKPDPATKAKLLAYVKRDRDMLVEDIRRGKPDIIITERHIFDWYAWAQADPLIAEELKNYREAGSEEAFIHREWNGTLIILQRKPPAPPG